MAEGQEWKAGQIGRLKRMEVFGSDRRKLAKDPIRSLAGSPLGTDGPTAALWVLPFLWKEGKVRMRHNKEAAAGSPKSKHSFFGYSIELCHMDQWVSIQKLLDDRDPEVMTLLEQHVLSLGAGMVPLLERAWENELDEWVQKRIEGLIRQLHFQEARQGLRSWLQGPGDYMGLHEVLQGYMFPDKSPERFHQNFQRLLSEIQWVFRHSPFLEQIRLLNHVVFDVHRLGAAEKKATGLSVHFVSTLLDTKTGSPIALCCLFLMLGERLELPLYPVRLPRHFVLASREKELGGYPRYYLNPYGQGAVFSHRELEHYLRQTGHVPDRKWFEVTDSKGFAKGWLEEMHRHVLHLGMQERAKELIQLLAEMT